MSAPFEGVEKALEVVVAAGEGSLRARGEAFARDLVERAEGTVIRRSVTERVDAYLLAESTLFVGDRHLLLLTCGRTRVARAAARCVEVLGAGALDALVLTRLGERFPEAQPTTLADDARALARLVEGGLVTLGAYGPHRGGAFVHTRAGRERLPEESRLRVVANDVAPEIAACFEGEARARQADVLAPLLAHVGVALRDAHDFTPSGHSLNVVDGSRTWALHVTPEAASSYVSLVTSEPDPVSQQALVQAFLATFRPRTCLVTSDTPLALPGAFHAERSQAPLADRTIHVVEGRAR